MKKAKKNNKGFSLVELIVVVLIMAIIAVSLAPQVMKWVENSRVSQDIQLKDSIASAFAIAATDADATGQAYGVEINGTTVTWTGAAADTATTKDAIRGAIEDVIDITKFECTSSNTDIKVSIDADGKVTSAVYKEGTTTEVTVE